MKYVYAFIGLLSLVLTAEGQSNNAGELKLFTADNKNFQYVGRIDFTDKKKPKFWLPGIYIKARFTGPTLEMLMDDEGHSGNYLEIVIDNAKPYRIQTTAKNNAIVLAKDLSKGEHTVVICKSTETNVGYLEFLGLRCEKLLAPPKKQTRKLEFIGNSITCGTGIDISTVPCNAGKWHDHNNAYMSYGPLIARSFDAQWHLTSYSGIGLLRSCCGIKTTMPQIFDKVNMKDNTIPWDFTRYQPDAVTICLGQNDGVMDSAIFVSAYVKFVGLLREKYPSTRIVCITSPMGNPKLQAAQKKYLTGAVNYFALHGDKKVSSFFFSQGWNSGCDRHPDMAEHALIANELGGYLKGLLEW